MKSKLDGLVAAHSLFHSRKTAVPEYFQDLDPGKLELSRHYLTQKHEWSGRMVSYLKHHAGIYSPVSELIHRFLCTPH